MLAPAYLATLDLSSRIIDRRREWGQQDADVAQDGARAAMSLLTSISRAMAIPVPSKADLDEIERHLTTLCLLLGLGATRGSLPAPVVEAMAEVLVDISCKLQQARHTSATAPRREVRRRTPLLKRRGRELAAV